ncbi:hypothetical protein KGF56_000543 [Candida oxycetoniae]|uniref:DUF1783-domain-containing protein n=1 Tax=Candida oxycetoniae TaxID=497107 RepID=A0AAI9WZT0_9ASCO|nr:uncharacterized protein KGF56_000543 [Candida oxycetoniae]KAI3406697.1 hypothetical protein KGF56_000543 [Candida oxycetoniae]
MSLSLRKSLFSMSRQVVCLRRFQICTRSFQQEQGKEQVNLFTSNNSAQPFQGGRKPNFGGSKPQITVDRELPYPYKKRDENRIYFVVFAVGITLSCLVIFNYEKSSSPIINSILYYLRRSTIAQDALGKDIDFASSWPWIWGTLNTVQGKIDIKFKVKGSEQKGWLILKADRESKMHPFVISEFVLEVDTPDSKVAYDMRLDPEYEFDL